MSTVLSLGRTWDEHSNVCALDYVPWYARVRTLQRKKMTTKRPTCGPSFRRSAGTPNRSTGAVIPTYTPAPQPVPCISVTFSVRFISFASAFARCCGVNEVSSQGHACGVVAVAVAQAVVATKTAVVICILLAVSSGTRSCCYFLKPIFQ